MGRAGLPWGLSPGPADSVFSLGPHWVFTSPICILVSFLYKDPSPIRLEPTPMSSFYLNHLFKSLIPKYRQAHSEVLGVRTSTWELRGTQFNP